MASQKLRLDPDELTPADLARAKVVLGGRNPYEVMNDPEMVLPLTMWCLLSRGNPALTWDEAMATPFRVFDGAGRQNGQGPPPSPPTATSEGRGGSSSKGASRPNGRNAAASPSRRRSAATSASNRPSTTG